MSGIHDLWLFVAAGLLLNVTPGPDMAYIAARSAAGGFRDGAAATFGITVPPFVVAPVLSLVIGVWLGWLPTGGWGTGSWANKILPITTLAPRAINRAANDGSPDAAASV